MLTCHFSGLYFTATNEPQNLRPEKMLMSMQDQPRKVHHTIGSITRLVIGQCCEETLACCDFRCIRAKGISGSELRFFPTHQGHADASYTSLTSAGFHYRTQVLIRLNSAFGNAHRGMCVYFWSSWTK